MQIEIRALHERLGATTIYVTHDQREALTMSHRIAVLNQGRIAQIGAPAEIYNHPADAFVADFIGEAVLAPVTRVDDAPCCSRAALARRGRFRKRGPRPRGPVGEAAPRAPRRSENAIEAVVR